MSYTDTITHAVALIERSSVTPDDGGCQDYLESVLAPLGFSRTRVDAGHVTNSIYSRSGEKEGLLAFAGHTDVVPTGPLEEWPYPPFSAKMEDGILHGRGAQDMKAAIACWISAVASLQARDVPLPDIQILITSDEEGESVDGTVRIVEHLQQQQRLPDAVIVGEPSSQHQVGDTVRRGRRGVVHVSIHVQGKQGHSAYPQDADNAAHHAVHTLQRILQIDWGTPAPGFPPTSCQITSLRAGEGASNVIPGVCTTFADIRYNPGIDFETIRARILDACKDNDAIRVDIHHEANAFSTPDGSLLDQVSESIRRITGIETKRDTGGGTSDGRFLAAANVPVVELGLTNDTIHQVGERVRLDELDVLTRIYTDIIENFE
ncbi:MAG TPA: succinyl-diaminopimelate desuccinylase [Mariprofundaceae bacterium]|nr:succinyl-diaminopimelate desuccinylase [Mariprofundaceae bacterium]